MIIYKITNIQNNKCYIGQTIGSIEQRWHRHINDAISFRLNTHFARAIRKYSPNSFKAEVIDSATDQAELTRKEQQWIIFYDSINNGYNETSAISKSGGNTYQSKTPQEMELIKEKIRQTKIGIKNPHSTKVKCKNIETKEELHFNTQAEMMKFFNETNHQFISRRCLKKIKVLYKGKWAIAYEDDDYNNDYTSYKQIKRAKRILVKDLKTEEIKEFPSFAEAERCLKLKPKQLSGKAYKKGKTFIYDSRFLIEQNLE